MRRKKWVLFGIISALAGYADSGMIKANRKTTGGTMKNLETIVDSFQDLYSVPTLERITELEMKLADLKWDGLYLSAPDSVEPDVTGIPILALSGFTSLREWEVEPRKNSTVLLADLGGGKIHFSSLFKRQVKVMKPVFKSARPSPESNGRRYGCVRILMGDSLPNGLPPGTYALAHISWDRLSNIRLVERKRESEPGRLPPSNISVSPFVWPWQRWAKSQAYKAAPDSPKIGIGGGLALVSAGVGDTLFGTFSIKARPIHIIPAEKGGRTIQGIRAGVNVDLLIFTLNRPFPEVVRVEVPVYSSEHIPVGIQIRGWFSVPFPFEPSEEERMLYAVADGEVAGPVRIPGTNNRADGR